jgi:ornithine cyclodeaminase
MLILSNADVRHVLDGEEEAVLAAVRRAYVEHERGATAVPESLFLRFPDNTRDRIIALPAYLGGAEPVAGMKWIASFPGNVAAGMERASAVVVLNSPDTGRPLCLLEGSVISARRTAASAALASATLPGAAPVTGVTVVGCGVINTEVLRFLRAVHPSLREVAVFDLDADRAGAFAGRCAMDLDLAAYWQRSTWSTTGTTSAAPRRRSTWPNRQPATATSSSRRSVSCWPPTPSVPAATSA